MNVFDKFIMGDTAGIDWCFENTHFINRLQDNGISKQYIMDCVMNEEPVSWERVEGNTYAVVFEAPINKDYKEIRVLMACSGNSIDLVTIMRNKEIESLIKKKMVKILKNKTFKSS